MHRQLISRQNNERHIGCVLFRHRPRHYCCHDNRYRVNELISEILVQGGLVRLCELVPEVFIRIIKMAVAKMNGAWE